MKTTTGMLIVRPECEPIYSEMATRISLDDEAAGLFVKVEQVGRTDLGKICIDPAEWPHIKAAIDTMMNICEAENGRTS